VEEGRKKGGETVEKKERDGGERERQGRGSKNLKQRQWMSVSIGKAHRTCLPDF
jgi:hypothetical protein